MSAALTTTSYAILGQLAMRPWTMYDLAAQMRRNVHFFFPRVESQLYAEPKRLVARGLAEATTEMTGRRARTVYTITRKGREELRRWLAHPPGKGPQLEFEAVLRVMLSPFGRDADLVRALQHAREDVRGGLFAVAERISQEYVSGDAPFQRYVQYRSIMHDFLLNFGQLIEDWTDRSLARIEGWPEQTEDERRRDAIEIFDKMRPRLRNRRQR